MKVLSMNSIAKQDTSTISSEEKKEFSFEEIMKRNEENRQRLTKERLAVNCSITKSLKKK